MNHHCLSFLLSGLINAQPNPRHGRILPPHSKENWTFILKLHSTKAVVVHGKKEPSAVILDNYAAPPQPVVIVLGDYQGPIAPLLLSSEPMNIEAAKNC